MLLGGENIAPDPDRKLRPARALSGQGRTVTSAPSRAGLRAFAPHAVVAELVDALA